MMTNERKASAGWIINLLCMLFSSLDLLLPVDFSNENTFFPNAKKIEPKWDDDLIIIIVFSQQKYLSTNFSNS